VNRSLSFRLSAEYRPRNERETPTPVRTRALNCKPLAECQAVIFGDDTETIMFLHVDPDNGLAIYDQT
jgi:hypothetical protein